VWTCHPDLHSPYDNGQPVENNGFEPLTTSDHVGMLWPRPANFLCVENNGFA
jgi:hypothetical protein